MDLQVPRPSRRDTSPHQGNTSLRKTTPSPNDDRRVTRKGTSRKAPGPNTASTSTDESAQSKKNEDQSAHESMRNILFPTFKNLRKLEVKVTNAQHHREFLNSLKEKNQVPKGLKVRSTVTTAELPPDLYEEWELAHVELSNKLRDIMTQYWERIIIQTQRDIDDAYHRISVNATEEEIQLISELINKATSSKREELLTKRQRKSRNLESGTAASPEENQTTSN
jgi:hypothetical protein